jgi:phage tail-like protein
LASKASEFLFDQVSMSHRFIVSIDDGKYDLGTWSRASGLQASWKPLVYRTGESNEIHVVPGDVQYTNIQLSRAACTDSATVQEWLATITCNPKPISGAIDMVDFVGIPIVSWHMRQMIPVAWKISEFDALGKGTVIETIDFVHTGFINDAAGLR